MGDKRGEYMRCKVCGEIIEDEIYWGDFGMCIYCYDLYRNGIKESDEIPKKSMATAGDKEKEIQEQRKKAV